MKGSRRRGHNEGSVFQRADGRWVASISLEDGKRRDVYGRTRKEAADKLLRLQRDLRAGLPLVREDQTVEQYLTSWISDIRPHLRIRSYARYDAAVRLHIVPTLGKVKLARLTQQQLEGLYAAKLKEGLSPSTVARVHAVLHKALSDAERLELVQRNVSSLVRAPRALRRSMTTFTPEQVQVFLRAIKGDPLEAFYVLAITTGIRRGEALALHWKDVDLDHRRIHIRYTLQDLKGGVFEFSPPKTDSSRRAITLTDMAVVALRRHRKAQRRRPGELGTAWQERDLVFTTATGGPIRGNHILQRHFEPLCKELGLPRIRLHDLRHTAASLLLRNRIPAKVVQEMLGHTTISMTLDIYSHVLPDMQQQAAASLDQLLAPPQDADEDDQVE
jgi:integrase